MPLDEVINSLNNLDAKLDAIVDKDGSVKKTFLRWILSHESATVALWVIMAAIGYGGWYVVTVGIPKHLTQIQSGYESLIIKNSETLKDISDKDRIENANARASFEKALDRFEKTFEAGFRAAGSSGNTFKKD